MDQIINFYRIFIANSTISEYTEILEYFSDLFSRLKIYLDDWVDEFELYENEGVEDWNISLGNIVIAEAIKRNIIPEDNRFKFEYQDGEYNVIFANSIDYNEAVEITEDFKNWCGINMNIVWS